MYTLINNCILDFEIQSKICGEGLDVQIQLLSGWVYCFNRK